MTEQSLFSDLLVIDCASFIAGPAAATILSDFGARVIKIEPPGSGDGYRRLKHLPGVPVCDINYPWRLTNRGKQSLALDLKQPEGRAVLDQLLAVRMCSSPPPAAGTRDPAAALQRYPRGESERDLRLAHTVWRDRPEAGNTGYDATAWWARWG